MEKPAVQDDLHSFFVPAERQRNRNPVAKPGGRDALDGAVPALPAAYAIVDIETTGGHARGSRITEIAVILHDGHTVVDRWESLVNPGMDIPPAIVALTGIHNEMVRNAPLFSEIAEKVFNLLEGRVFVAHNVNFDYSFVHHQLQEAGYRWEAQKLCTVRLSRKLKPGLLSYSLGNICDAFGIRIGNRHRAGGDADATALLFGLLLKEDQNGVFAEMLKRIAPFQRLPPHLPPEDFEVLPASPGVYYFHDRTGAVIYVGKGVNLKKKVASHFSGQTISPQKQQFMQDIHAITHEVCATELMALLLECREIKRLGPAYNRALRRPRFGLVLYEDQRGYKRLSVGKFNNLQQCLQVVHSENDGLCILRWLVREFQLDTRLCGLTPMPEPGERLTAFSENLLPGADEHNAAVEKAVLHLTDSGRPFLIRGKGRHEGENSCT